MEDAAGVFASTGLIAPSQEVQAAAGLGRDVLHKDGKHRAAH